MSSSLDCLSLLRNGLPKGGKPNRKIVIVGAGIAGITAGMLLKDAGHHVTILEAQNRLPTLHGSGCSRSTTGTR